MSSSRAALVAVVIAVAVTAGWWMFRRAEGTTSIDLLAQWELAQKRPDAALFSLVDIALKGETKKAIAVDGTSTGTRLIWKVRVPEDGWLRVSLGLKPEAWTAQGDGVLFLVGVSDGHTFEQLFSQIVDPSGKPDDRRWIPVNVELSAFAGQEVDIVFNTYASQPNRETDQRNDFALWGAPEIYVR